MKIKYKILIWFLTIGITPVLFAGVLFYRTAKLSTEKAIIANLSAVADLKKRELREWLMERFRDISMTANNDDIRLYITETNSVSVESVDNLISNNNLDRATMVIADLRHEYNFSRVFLVDVRGKILLSTKQEEVGLITNDDFVKEVLANQAVSIKDIFYNQNKQPLMAFGGPVFAINSDPHSASRNILGALIFEVNMENTVFPILSHWSKMWETGEMLIGKRDHDNVVFLSRLKYNQQAPLDFTLTRAENIGLPMWFASSGNEGIARTRDYRGVNVLSAYRNIPIMDWGFVVKMDESEAFATIVALRNEVILVSVILIFILIILTWVASREVYLPINLLQHGVEIIEKGDLTHKVGINAQDEIGQLSRAFDKMVGAIKRSRAEVDRKVKIQTKQIVDRDKKLATRQKALLNILEDIEKEKQEAFLERDNANTILNSIGDGVFVVDKNYKITVFNRVASELSGFSVKDVVGKRYGDVLKFVDQKKGFVNSKFITDAINFGKTSLMPEHTVLIKKDGSQAIVADVAAPLKDIYGKIRGCVVAFRDATREAEVDRMKTEFVSLASHQLNTPLTGIKWFLELLLKGRAGKLNKQQLDFVNQAATSNERIIRLVGELLDISRIESGVKFVIEKKSADAIMLVKSVIAESMVLAKESKRGLKITLDDKLPEKVMINIDTDKIRQVLNNLIDNAVKYGDDNSEIKVGLVDKKQEVVFSVKNKGVGIPPKQQSRVFEKFFRADNIITKESTGTGLGLYIAKAIVDAHGGRIWLKSVPGKETTFYFSLLK